MKIECDKCSAKYSIADEKVRGKTFKIRCKKCSNVIIVRDKGAVAANAGAAAAVDEAAPGWHLAINGETVGPMAEDEVRQRYDAGEIDKETAVWQEGFDDWLPLADVPAFGDLPEPSGDDPFAASANQNDYAAGGAAAAGAAAGGAVAGAGLAAAASVAATGTDDVDSPRVSKLTGQRNENSVLFSLDSLQAMATAGAATGGAAVAAPAMARAAANPSKGLATSAPSSEGSGLIDIRALGAMVGGAGAAASAAPQAAADDAALPSFGGGALGGLSATPLVVTPAPAAVGAAAMPAPAPARSNAPLYIMMVILILAVGGLGAFIYFNKEEPKTIVREVPAAAPSVKDDDGKDDDGKDDDGKDDEKEGDKAAAEDEGESEGDSEGDSEGGSGGDDDGVAAASSSGSRKKSGTSGRKKSGTSGSKSGGTSTPKDSSSGSKKPKSGGGGGSPSVDCILDPSKCGSGSKKPKGGSGGSSGGSTKPGAPVKLSTTEIKAGIAKVKPAAKACGPKHGAKPGEKVKIRVSVSGSTGKVTKATPMSPHTGTSLGSCVAGALKKATFKEFQNSSMGFQYPITM